MTRRFLFPFCALLCLTACTAGFGMAPTLDTDLVEPGAVSAVQAAIEEADFPPYTAWVAEDLEATVRTLTEYLQALENEKATLIGNSSGLYLPDGSTISYDLQSGEDPSKVAVQGLRDRITLLQRNRVRVALGLGAEYD